MTLSNYFHSQFNLLQNLDFCARVILSAIAGAIIGLERSHRFKEAGVRTHVIVCCTTAVLMIVSKYGFVDLTNPDGGYLNGTRGVDAARIAAQAVSGISFLCAGVIFKTGNNVRGLTTAAGLWFTAGMGLAFGAGMYIIGFFALFLLLGMQFVAQHMFKSLDTYSGTNLHFKVKDVRNFHNDLMDQLKVWNATLIENDMAFNEDGTTEYDLVVRRKNEITFEEVTAFAKDRDDIISYRNNSLYNHFR
jgi:putative Mg2+ transporter-C (MgtC) family protein